MKMNKTILLFVLSIALAAADFNSLAQVAVYSGKSIPANAEIAGAGNAGLPDSSGVGPVVFALPGNASVVTMQSVTGKWTLDSGRQYNDPDGVAISGSGDYPAVSYSGPYGGISGIRQPGAGALVGVFETATGPIGPAPATLDFTVIGTSFTSLAPALNQVFYVGDGLTGDGSGAVQQFNVPAGATRLFLGCADACSFNGSPSCYGDNSGVFNVSLEVLPAGGTGNIFFYTNSTDTNWFKAANWSPNQVPGAGDTAVITGETVGITNLASVGTLALSGGTLSAPFGLTIVSGGSWTGGVLNGQVTVSPTADFYLSNPGGTLDLPGTTLTNLGTVVWSGGTLRGNGGTVVNNNGAWMVSGVNDQINNAYGGAPAFINNGSFTVQNAATQTVTFSGVKFTNNFNAANAVDAQSGTLLFEGGGFLNGGFQAEAGATIRFDQVSGVNAPFTTGPNFRCAGLGAIQLTGGAMTLGSDQAGLGLMGGTVTLGPNFQSGGAITNLTLDGSGLLGTNTLAGTMNWLAGSISGLFTISASGALNLSGAGDVTQYAALTNAGHIAWNGSGDWSLYNDGAANNGLIVNLAGGVIDAQCNNEMRYDYGYEWFGNAGLFRKTASTGTTIIDVVFTNTGTVDVQSGEMDFDRVNGSYGGVFQAANGTALKFNAGGVLSGSFTAGFGAGIGFDGGTFSEVPSVAFGGAGTVAFNGGTLTLLSNTNPNLQLNGGTLNLPAGFQGGVITNLTVAGVTLTGTNTVTGVLNLNGGASGPLVVASGGVVNWSGGTLSRGVTVSPGGVLNLTGQSYLYAAGMTNSGTINWTGGYLTLIGGSTFYNQAGAVFNIQCDNYYIYYNTGPETLNNAGLVQKFGTTGQTPIYVNLVNSGVVVAQSGTLYFDANYYGQNGILGGDFQADAGATLEFGGGGNLTGSFTAAAGGNIMLVGGTFTPTPTMVFNGPGTNTMTGGTITLTNDLIANLQLTGGTVVLTPTFQGGAITNLALNGASLGGTNTLTGVLNLYGTLSGPLTVVSNATLNLNGSIMAPLTLLPGATMNWSNGYLETPLAIPANAVLNVVGPGTVYVYDSPLTNAGTVNWNGGSIYIYAYYSYYGTAFYNLAGATLNIQSDVSGSGGGVFNNAGLVRQWPNPGTTSLSWVVNNTGLVDVQTGTLIIYDPIQNSNVGGTYLAEAGATLNFNAGGYLTGEFTAAGGGVMDFSGGTFTNTTSTVLDGVGAHILDGGTLNLLYDFPANLQLLSGDINPGPNYQGGSIVNLTLNGLGLAGSNIVTGILNLQGNVAGPLTVAGNATASVSGSILAPVTLQPGATFDWTGEDGYAPVTVQAGAVWNLAPTNYAYFDSPVTNSGTINWSGGYLELDNGYYYYGYYYGGNIYNLAGAAFNILTDQPIYQYDGGFIENGGTFRKSGTSGINTIQALFTNTGTIEVESGTLQFTNTFSQTGGTWDIGIGGLLTFHNSAPLPATLKVTTGPGYLPSLTNDIILVDYPSYSGSISTVNLPADGAFWQLSYGNTALNLIVTNQPFPGVSLTSPTNNAGFSAPASINMSAVGFVANGICGITGFGGNGSGWTVNQAPDTGEEPTISGNVLHLTHGKEYEGGSVFFNTPQYVNAFTASFTYHNSTPYDYYDPADGFAFVLQDQGLRAVGEYGLNLGYGGSPGITPSAAIAFNLYTGYGAGTKFVTGSSNYVNSGYQSVSPVNLDATDPLNVTLSYNGSSLTEILLDTVTGAGFTNSYPVNLSSAVGGITAYVGLTGATGAGYSVQDISNFSFSSPLQSSEALASVQFYAGATLLGSGVLQGQSYNYAWNSVPAGNYVLTAVAADPYGKLATSAPVNITVYAPGLQPTNYTWTGAVSSDWFGASNWSPNGVPGALDNVTIANGGAPLVGHNTSVNNATLTSGTIGGSGTLTVTNTFTWSGGAVTNTLVIATNATLLINSGSGVSLPNATLVNQGTVQWTGGGITGGPGTLITNGSGGLWWLQTDNTLALGNTAALTNGLFVNNGTVRKTRTTGTTYFGSLNFTNNGEVDAQSGTIAFQSGGTLSGVYNTAAGATIQFGGGAFTLDSLPSFTGTGANLFSGGTLTMLHDVAPQLQLTGGSVILGPNFQNAGAITNLTLSGATLLGTNTVTGTLNWATGTVGSTSGNGALTVAPAGLVVLGVSNNNTSVTLYNLSLINNGEVLWLCGYVYCPGSTITNNNLWLVQGGYYMTDGTFVNNGLIKQTSGGSVIKNPLFINNGTVEAEAGTLYLESGGTFAGAYNAAAGAAIAFAGGSNTLNTLAGLPNFTGLGSFLFSGGTLFMNNDIDPALQLTGGTVLLGTNFQNGGMINNLAIHGSMLGGTNTVTGSLTFTGGTINGPLTVASNASLTFLPGQLSVYNTAAITNFGSVFCPSNTASFYAETASVCFVNNGLWLDQGSSDFYGSGAATFVNNGIYRKEGSTWETSFDIPLINNGLFDVRTGYVYLEDGGVLGGTFNVAVQAYLTLDGGNFTAGLPPANFTGTGSVEFYATLTLTNYVIPSLPLTGGTVLLGPNFQRNGAITNLTLAGAALGGTNFVSGTLNLGAGSSVSGSLTVLSNGLLTISGTSSSSVSFQTGAKLINQGVVDWTGGEIYTYPATVITNFGLWLVETDNQIYNGYYYYNYPNTPFFNPGTFAKTTTTGATTFYGIAFLNSGTLNIQSGSVNFATANYDTNSVAYAQTGATLAFGVSAPNLAGRLILSTNLSLDGTLEADLLNGYAPTLGDEVSVISFGPASRTAFTDLVLPPLTGMTWDVEAGASGVNLRVVPAVATTSRLQISGTVRDANNNPITGLTVYAAQTGVTNLIQNGSFEVPLASPGAGDNLYPSGATNVPGWTVVGPTNDNIAVYYNNWLGPAEDGTQYFDPTGSTGGAGISQTFPTVAGTAYQLVFYHGTYNHHGLNAVLGVTIDTNYYTFGETDGSNGSLDWRRVVIPFTASSNQTTLTFSDLTGFSSDGGLVDNVQVIPPGFGTVAQATTDTDGNYQMTVPNGTFRVGVDGLPGAGYNNVPEQLVALNGNNNTAVNFTTTPLAGGQFFSITTSVNPPALGTASGGGTGFHMGAPVTVSVVQNANPLPYFFAGWAENGVLESTNVNYSFTAFRNRSLVANFALPGLVVAASNNPPSDGGVSGAGIYTYNTTSVLTAFPLPGYKFINWTENGVVVSANNPLSTLILTNEFLVANYGDANPIHVVTISSSPAGLTTGTGAGSYTNGQTAIITAPSALTNSGAFYVFQGFTLAGSPVTSAASFSKSFSTFDPATLTYVAVYQLFPLQPQIIAVRDNYPNPVPATTGFLLTFQFDRSMRTNPAPLVLLTNAAPNAVQATVGANGLWTTTAISNDTYQTPGITFGNGMDGNVQVDVSGGQDIYGHAISTPTNVLNLVVHSTKPLPPGVAITSPANGALLSASQSFAIGGTITSTNFSGGVVDLYANGVLLGVGVLSVPPASFSFTVNSGLAGGSYALMAVAVDASGLTGTSLVTHVTVNNPGSTLIDFEALDASAGPVGGAILSNYLAGFGVTAANVTTGTSLVAANDQVFLGGGVVRASSGDNFLAQTGANGAVSYTLLFSQPYASVSWVRPELLAGTTGAARPGWRAHILDSQGNDLGSAGENALGSFTNVPAARFTLLGHTATQSVAANIAAIRFDGDNQGLSSLDTLPLDDLLLSTMPPNTTLTVTLALTNTGTSFPAPAQLGLSALATNSLGMTVTEVDFYEGSSFVSRVTPSKGAAALTLYDLAAGSYQFTAVASDASGAVSSSPPLSVLVTPVTGLSVINFDVLNTSAGSVGGAALSNYLATYGVILSNVTVGTAMEAVNGGLVTGSGGAVASSPPNYFTQAGLNQPVTFTLAFQSPLQAFGFTRVALLAGAGGVSHPQWTATLLDANGVALGSAGENLITSATNVPARSFVLTGLNGDGIASVRFDSDSQRTAAFSAVLLDDLIMNGTSAIPMPAALSVSLVTSLPVTGTSQAPVTDTLTATVSNNLGTNYSVSFYAGPNLVGSVSYPSNSVTLSNVLAGTYVLRAQVVDNSGVTAFSSPKTNTVAVTGGNSQVVNFDSLNAAKGAVTDGLLSNYLAGFGITVATNISPGTTLAVENQAAINGGAAVAASSPPNIVTQIGSSGPVSYTVNFSTPLTNFGFTRPELLASPFVSHPAWQATAFDAAGVVLGQAGEGLIGSYTNVGAQAFNLNGPGIASVQFASLGSGLTTFNAMLADDFVLTTNASGVSFPPAVAITSPPTGLQLTSPVTLTVTAQAADPAGIASVSFYANGALIGSAAASPYAVPWANPGVGGYALTAVALDKNRLSRTSPVVNVTILPSAFVFGILTPPVSQTAKVGSSVTFSVATTGTGAVTYQWYQNGSMLAGQTESALTLFPVNAGDAGSYTVTATSGGVTLTSSPPAVLTVAQPPVITTPPLGQTVPIGANVVLSVAASGDGPFNYQWLLNGAGIPGATNSTYSILAAQPLNSGSFQVVVGNAVAFVESAPAVVLVLSGNGALPAGNNDNFSNRISINPLLGPVEGNNQSATSEPGEPRHDGKPGGKSIWYTWQASFTGVISLTTQGSDFETLLAVYTGNNLTNLTPVAADDDSGPFWSSLVQFNVTAGTNYQIAVDGFQGASGDVVLGMPSGTAYRVLPPGSGNGVPVITNQPASQLVPAGTNVTLRVGASNALTYQWFFQGAPVGVGGTGSSLVITNVQDGSVGLYDVLVANAVGSVKSEQAILQIAAPNQPGAGGFAQSQFGNAVYLAGLTTNKTSVSRKPASGGGDSRGYSVSQVFSTVGATKEPGEPNHCGQAGGASEWFVYTAPITNGTATLDVNTAGSTFNTILAIYTGPGTNFASLIPQGCGFVTNYQKQGQPNVVIPGVLPGTRFYIAVDGYQGASGTVQLHIGLGAAPSLVSPPVSQFVIAGSNATFNVTAIGSTNFGYQWQFNSVSIASATNSSYTVTNASTTNAGSYTVIVSNVVMTVTSAPPATLTIQSAPAITAQPANQTVFLGQKAGFAVTVVGVNSKANPLVYQWYYGNYTNKTPVAGATTSTLAFPAAQYTNNGSYFVTITNSYGKTNSALAVLTVVDTNLPAVAFSAPPNNFTTNAGTVTVTGTASDKYAALASVQVEVNQNGFQTASGTTNWTKVVSLVPGTNIITAQSVDLAGNKSPANTLRLIYLASSRLIVQTNGVGSVTSASGATNGASLVIGRNYTILAAPGGNYLFTNWTSGASPGPLTNYPGGPSLTFLMFTNMILQANFVTNPFPAAAGVYNGLFYPAGRVTEASSGFVSAAVSSNGTYSAKLLLDGGSNYFSGAFDLTGTAQTNLTRSPVSVTLNLHLYPADARMTGSVSMSSGAAGWNSAILADRAVFSASANPATNYAGQFTLLLPPGTLAPDGYGYAAITNSLGGISTGVGALADGSSISWAMPIAQDGSIPLYQSLYSSQGSLLGWIIFTNDPPQNVSADSWVSWIKPSVPGTLYPSGFTNLSLTGVLGSPFTNTPGAPVLDLTDATLVLSGGNLARGALTFTNLNLTGNTLTNLAKGTSFGETNYLVLAINTNNGLVTVTFQATGAKTNTTARGAVLQNQTNALGAFPGTNQTGSFILH